jgi:peptide-methionine (S)-S-oxide reductase
VRAQHWILGAAIVVAVAFVWLRGGFVGVAPSSAVQAPPAPAPAAVPATEGVATATFASGCFWCTESDFDTVPGVVSTTSGYTGGSQANPTYEAVSSGRTGHAEAVRIVYDPKVVSYETLLDHYWRNVDPFVANRQFCDVGSQYRPVIFVHDATQRMAAEQSKAAVQRRFSPQPVLVEIVDAGTFYPAEEYHQDYHTKNPVRYKFYRGNCGRDARLKQGKQRPIGDRVHPTKLPSVEVFDPGYRPVIFCE